MTRRSAYAILFALLAAPAGATTLCVNKAGGSCFTTIQAAVNAAAAGDLVKINADTYFENLLIPPGKDGLQIQGANKLTTIVDGDVPNTLPGFQVQSNFVKISNLTVRNGLHVGIYATANGLVVQGVRVVGIRGGTYTAGIMTIAGNAHQILSNEIHSVSRPGGGQYQAGILIAGTNSIIKGNTISQAGSFGVFTLGAGNQVVSNKISNIGNVAVSGGTYQPAGINAQGNLAVVTGNSIENAINGIIVTGKDPIVASNKLTSAGQVSVTCVTCTGGSVKSNTSLGSFSNAFLLDSDAAGLVAQSNKASQVLFNGFALGIASNSIQLLQNSVTDTVGLLGSCFFAQGTGHTLTKNTATRCGVAGFYVNGDASNLSSNTAAGSGASGFVVDGNSGGPPYTNAVLTGNKAILDNGQGFAVINLAASTTLTGNTATNHRVDFCNMGSGTTSGSNTFGSTSTTCDILQ